jgi:PKD repeat protein
VSSWVWDFGDGNTSTDQHPAYQYETPGTYTVSLTVSDGVNTDAVTYVDYLQVEIGTGLEGEDGVPEDFVLNQNYPNPFNPTTNIRFGLPSASHVELTVYNLLGQKVLTLVNGTLPAGYHMKVLDGQQLSSGIYLYELKAGKTRLIEKMTLIK